MIRTLQDVKNGLISFTKTVSYIMSFLGQVLAAETALGLKGRPGMKTLPELPQEFNLWVIQR